MNISGCFSPYHSCGILAILADSKLSPLAPKQKYGTHDCGLDILSNTTSSLSLPTAHNFNCFFSISIYISISPFFVTKCL